MEKVDTLVLDETGASTTKGKRLAQVIAMDSVSENDLLWALLPVWSAQANIPWPPRS